MNCWIIGFSQSLELVRFLQFLPHLYYYYIELLVLSRHHST